jgi:hypothetical protein
MSTDYYKILEVSQFASKYEIKKSYRRLAFKYHPDRNSGNKSAESKFKEISEAYRILSDENNRHKYDLNYRGNTTSEEFSQNQHGTENKEEVRTPKEVFKIVQDFRQQVDQIGRSKINHFALYNRLKELFSNDLVDFLLKKDDLITNKNIIKEACFCCKYLQYSEFQRLIPIFIKLAGTDNESLITILSFSKKSKIYDHWDRKKGVYILGSIILFIMVLGLLNPSTVENIQKYNDTPASGDLYPNKDPLSLPKVENANDIYNTPKLTPIISPEEEYKDWNKINLTTGTRPDCYNFTPRYDYSLDNRLEIIVGSNTDVVIKLINQKTGKCIRYVYIRNNSTFNIANIPEGKYYLKIAYGSVWRQKVENGKCLGKFVQNSIYKKGDEILDFNKIYKGVTVDGDNKYTNYQIPSFSLSLDVIKNAFDANNFETDAISEDEFNN